MLKTPWSAMVSITVKQHIGEARIPGDGTDFEALVCTLTTTTPRRPGMVDV
jgi:hypothetical protein